MDRVAGVLQDKLPQLKRARKLYLAYSGGLDSTVLLFLLKQNGVPCTALHINHQLSVNADSWQSQCEKQAKKWKIPIITCKVTVNKTGKGLEDAARLARYAVFERSLEKGDVLLTAHHADDQAETFLYRLMRGAGLTGLSGIKRERSLGRGRIVRPLLQLQREDIRHFALQNRLQWIEDESNANENFDRNYLRRQILPLLKARWPVAITQISNSVELIAKETDLLREYAEEDYQRCLPQKERQGESLSIAALLTYSLARRQNILRYWQWRLGYNAASSSQLNQLEELMRARSDAVPELITSNWSFRRFAKRIYLLPTQEAREFNSCEWHSAEALKLGDGSFLQQLEGEATVFRVSYRNGGERCRPLERDRSQTLKKLLQEYKLEPWWRDQVPLIYLGEELCAVGDLFVCEAGKNYRFLWHLPNG